jgi:hypothetical protein
MRLAGRGDDRREQSVSVADRSDADVSQIVGRQLGEHIGVNLVVSELLLVFSEAENVKPFADQPWSCPTWLVEIIAQWRRHVHRENLTVTLSFS